MTEKFTSDLPILASDYEQAIELVRRENERLRSAIRNLGPLQDIDWHGKWRIRKCLDALSNKDSDNG